MYNIKTAGSIVTESGYYMYTKIMGAFMSTRRDKRFYAVKLEKGESRSDAVYVFHNSILVMWDEHGQNFFLADSECKKVGGGVSHEGNLVRLSIKAAYNNMDEICNVLPPKIHAKFRSTVNAAMMGVA